ncbi:MAG: hypothetical protein LBU85_04005 [Treponema sp.]|jgi:hypothetical protein|nr:hypothetical protein [Treponema sp.]
MELKDKPVDELKSILENTDSLELIKYIKTLNRNSGKSFYEKLEKIMGENYVNLIKLSLSNRM